MSSATEDWKFRPYLKAVCELSEPDSKRVKQFSVVNGKTPETPNFVFLHGFTEGDTGSVQKATRGFISTKVKVVEIRVGLPLSPGLKNPETLVGAKVESELLAKTFETLKALDHEHFIKVGTKYETWVPLFRFGGKLTQSSLKGCSELIGAEFSIGSVKFAEV